VADRDPVKLALEKLGISAEDPERAAEELEELAAQYIALVTSRRALSLSARSFSTRNVNSS
jgi:hypothetical protein